MNKETMEQQLLDAAQDEERFKELLDTLKPGELVEAEKFLWDWVMEQSRNKGREITRKTITSRMTPTSVYQHSVGCDEREDYCRANICIYTNPVCASNKLKMNLLVIREFVVETQNM